MTDILSERSIAMACCSLSPVQRLQTYRKCVAFPAPTDHGRFGSCRIGWQNELFLPVSKRNGSDTCQVHFAAFAEAHPMPGPRLDSCPARGTNPAAKGVSILRENHTFRPSRQEVRAGVPCAPKSSDFSNVRTGASSLGYILPLGFL